MLFYLWNLLAQSDLGNAAIDATEKKSAVQLSDIIIIALLMVVVFIVMRSTRRRAGNRNSSAKKTAKQLVDKRLSENPNITINRLQELMAALADMSREINGNIDTRTTKLELLLAKADKRIAEYELIMEKLQAQKAMEALAAIRPSIQNAADTSDEIENIEEIIIEDEGLETFDDGAGSADYSAMPPEVEQQEKATSAGYNSKQGSINEQILTLARDGISLEEISRATGRPSGEVELILNLNGIKLK